MSLGARSTKTGKVEWFEVPLVFAMQMQAVKNILDDLDVPADEPSCKVPLPNVDASTFTNVLASASPVCARARVPAVLYGEASSSRDLV